MWRCRKQARAPAASRSRLRSAFKRHPGIWFGWSGRAASKGLETKTIEADNISYVVTDLPKEDYDEYYNGFANRVLWPILHYRLDLAEFTRRDLSGYLRVNDHFADELQKVLLPDDVIWVHDYHFLPLRQGVARARPQEQDRLLPAYLRSRRRRS